MLVFQHYAGKAAQKNSFTMRIPPSLLRLAQAFLVGQGLLVLSAAVARGQDIPTPPDLYNIATGEKIPGADVLKTKDYGAIAIVPPRFERFGFWRMVLVQIPDGLQPNDIVLAVDGLRIYGSRDFELARFRNALSTSTTLLVNRDGDLRWVKLHDLQPGRDLEVSFDTDAEQDRILEAMESMGMALTDENVRAALRQLPAEAAMELDQWAKSQPNADTAWVQEFINLFVAVQGRHYADATKPAHEPPVPYFQRLEKFYLKLADENKAAEVAPDLKGSGETPEFYVLALPVPNYQPPLGELKFSDRRFQALLERKYALFGRSDDPELVTAAQKYATTGTDGLDMFLGQVKASLLDSDNQSMLPLKSGLVRGVSGTLLASALADQMKDPSAIDWPLNAYAMIAMDWATGAWQNIAPILRDLAPRSPYLARSAMEGLFFIRHAERNRWRFLNESRNLIAKNNNFLGPDAPEIYTWALAKVQPIAVSLDLVSGNPLPNPYFLLTGTPYAEMEALKGEAAPAAGGPAPGGTPAAGGTGAW
jgi:hypothetical protein